MSRYLFTVWPLVGHINPFVSVARAVQARGHEVAFYTSSRVRPLLEDEGFAVLPFEQVAEDRIWAAVHAVEGQASLGWRDRGQVLRAFRDWLGGTLADQVTDIRLIVDEWRPD